MKKIVSGGQTGVDRAALDLALKAGIPCGGWCPKGRLAEDGPIDPRYPLKETPSAEYRERTEWNVRDSDGTLILTRGKPTYGTAMTVDFAKDHEKPCLIVDLEKKNEVEGVKRWIETNRILVLNVAGPRESKCPGIYQESKEFLKKIFLP